MARILSVEDEPDLMWSLSKDLERQGHQTGSAADGAEGLRKGREGAWDLILLDVMLPKMDGFDVCTELRRAGIRSPIIFLTARAQDAEKEIGLDSGADDYITKPFSMRELRARVRAHLRRSEPIPSRTYRFGDCEVDFDRATLMKSEQPVVITPLELRLLDVFLKHRGRVLSRNQLIDGAWGPGMAITDRAVDTHVFNLRRKIETRPAQPRFLVGVRGLGYRFEDEDLTKA